MIAGGLRVGGELDRYVSRAFLEAYGVSLFTLLGLYAVVDLAQNVDEYVLPKSGGSSSTADLALYYLLCLPDLYQKTAPFITLSAGLYVAVRMVQAREWGAALSAGVSSRRLLAPMLVLGALLAVGAVGLRELATKRIGEERDAVHRRLVNRQDESVLEAVWARDRAGRPVFIERFVVSDEGRPTVTAEGLETALQEEHGWELLRAKRAEYVFDPTDPHWRLEGAALDRILADGSLLHSNPERLAVLELEPRDVLLAARAHEEPLSLSGLEAFELMRRDPDNASLQTVFQGLLAFPVCNVIFLLMALPFAVGGRRFATLRGPLQGILVCCLYFVTDYVCRSLGMQGSLSPLIAGWGPVVVFGSLGAVLYGAQHT